MEVLKSLDDILEIIKDPTLTSNQRHRAMAKASESMYSPIEISSEAQEYFEKDIIFDMWEGKMPYRPRYVIPDYEKFFLQGSEFLMLAPPTDIWEAVGNLMSLYHNVPSVSNLPVYMGHLDRLLEPFVQKVSDEEAYKAIKLLLTHVDRTISDAFFHCNIGPYDTKAGRIILDLSAEMDRPCPNMSLIYNENTPDDFAIKAIEIGLKCSKPSFVNDRIYSKDWGKNYAVSSCYNVFNIGGGGYTLGRLNLQKLGLEAKGPDHFIEELIPRAVNNLCELMDKRVQFMIDTADYFGNSFLAKEGLIEQDKFLAMFGLVGLAEGVNLANGFVEEKDRFGHSEEATLYGEKVLDKLNEEVAKYKPKYGKIMLHAQVGVDTDLGVSAGTRIPVHEDVPMLEHLKITARMHKHFPTGTGDIYSFDETATKNPKYVLDIIKGAFGLDMRYISLYSSDSDVIRITGYLVKKSDMKAYEEGKATLQNATIIGHGAATKNHITDRQIRSTEND